MVKMEKKAWIRIVEAFIAIILIAVVLLLIYNRYNVQSSQDEIIKIEDTILSEIVANSELREKILSAPEVEGKEGEYGVESELKDFVENKLPTGLGYEVKICDIDFICSQDEYREEVYVRKRIVSSTLQEYSPRKIKLFVWEEG